MKFLETAINKYLALDPEAPEKLREFDGRSICLDISGLNKKIYLEVAGDRLHLLSALEGEADATLRGSPLALFRLGMARDTAPLLLSGEVEIIGDMRLGRAFKAMLANMQIDWEEQLSTLTGDAAAHGLMGLARNIRDWTTQAGESVAMDVSEYLQEESRDVVSGAEIEEFCTAVDTLRADVERAAARIERVAQETQT